jgi:hypothetical protein
MHTECIGWVQIHTRRRNTHTNAKMAQTKKAAHKTLDVLRGCTLPGWLAAPLDTMTPRPPSTNKARQDRKRKWLAGYKARVSLWAETGDKPTKEEMTNVTEAAYAAWGKKGTQTRKRKPNRESDDEEPDAKRPRE